MTFSPTATPRLCAENRRCLVPSALASPYAVALGLQAGELPHENLVADMLQGKYKRVSAGAALSQLRSLRAQLRLPLPLPLLQLRLLVLVLVLVLLVMLPLMMLLLLLMLLLMLLLLLFVLVVIDVVVVDVGDVDVVDRRRLTQWLRCRCKRTWSGGRRSTRQAGTRA